MNTVITLELKKQIIMAKKEKEVKKEVAKKDSSYNKIIQKKIAKLQAKLK